jgi:DNA-directed RNA polymerase subunit E'/Rpb7
MVGDRTDTDTDLEDVEDQPDEFVFIKTKKNHDKTKYLLFEKILISKKIPLAMNNLGNDIISTLEKYIQNNFEGKCHKEGYLKKGTSNIIHYSAGIIFDGNQIVYDTVFECDVCFLSQGMLIECIIVQISNAGIRCVSSKEKPSPIIAFVPKEHKYENKQYRNYYNDLKEGDEITLKMLSQRFELNDLFVEMIAELHIHSKK